MIAQREAGYEATRSSARAIASASRPGALLWIVR